jgi:hypothetical protein
MCLNYKYRHVNFVHFETRTKPINIIRGEKECFYLKIMQTSQLAAIVLKSVMKRTDVSDLKILMSCRKRQYRSYFKIISIEV